MLTQKQHKNMAKLLKAVKPMLTPENRFAGICNFCPSAAEKAGVPARTEWLVRNWIRSQLGTCMYVHSWLCVMYNVRLTDQELYSYRLSWIDHMIQILES